MILVTGSSRGIGKAIADKLGAECLSRKELDVTKEVSLLLSVDVLVNCASAGVITKPLEEISFEEYRQFMAVDLDGVFNTCKAVIPYMKKNRYGRIINITSLHTALSWKNRAVYAMAKAGVAGFTRSLACELGEYGITCNCVAPGPIDTPRIRKLNEDNLGMINGMCKRSPNLRLGKSEEVAEVVKFLIDNPHINGAEIRIDGGYSVNGEWE